MDCHKCQWNGTRSARCIACAVRTPTEPPIATARETASLDAAEGIAEGIPSPTPSPADQAERDLDGVRDAATDFDLAGLSPESWAACFKMASALLSIERVEDIVLLWAVWKDGRQAEAARRLGISRQLLAYRLHQAMEREPLVRTVYYLANRPRVEK